MICNDMRITKIVAQQKQTDRVSIFVDDVYSFSLTLDQLLEAGLRIGVELDEQDIKRYQELSAEGKLRARALEWLMIRPRSAYELGVYLKRKGATPEATQSWIEEFQRKKYQSDDYFATWWVEQRRRSKQRSSGFIRSELLAKRVSGDSIDRALAENETDDRTALRELIAKKRTQSRYREREALVSYLQRQGYRYSDIVEALGAADEE